MEATVETILIWCFWQSLKVVGTNDTFERKIERREMFDGSQTPEDWRLEWERPDFWGTASFRK